MSNNRKEHVGIVGTYKEIVRDNKTGEVLDVFEQKNVVLNQGIQSMWQAMSTTDSNTLVIETIKLGNDVGTGTVTTPEQPTASYTETDQSVIYEIPFGDVIVSYPNASSVQFFANVNGSLVMNNYPTEPNVVYTSAALYNNAGQAFSYKRFTGRTISADISVDISWTLDLANA